MFKADRWLAMIVEPDAAARAATKRLLQRISSVTWGSALLPRLMNRHRWRNWFLAKIRSMQRARSLMQR